jgi:hypothetical protein
MTRNSISCKELSDGDYDCNGWPKGELRCEWRSFQLAHVPHECWVAEYEKLPGYCGEGATVDDALKALWQDLGERPHFRVTRNRRTNESWKRHFTSQHNAWAAGALIGFGTLSKDSVSSAAAVFPVRATNIQTAQKDFKALFEPINGYLVAGSRQMSENDLKKLTQQKIELSMFMAEHMPWRLERDEARTQFPNNNG